ncbi:UDP-glucose 4-epimerase GalE [Christensenellaceae bacterium OttesenSCG-928-L17]|nr:UDP-glucose 4-epimerase GalE [Christensenellaceae bacterium OttesenSCG-928-L17]
MKVLLTGGAGYIGSHIAVELSANGHTAIIADNLLNSNEKVISRINQITNIETLFFKIDIRDKKALNQLFTENQIDAVIHLAGLKAVGESVKSPLKYYLNNIDSTLTLLEVMGQHHVDKIVFSSSATVYGDPTKLPIQEDDPVGVGITNPYGKTKYFIEEIIKDASIANPKLKASLLRYFNPVGAHESGLIGEDPRGVPNNLMPYLTQVAVGKRPFLEIFGDDYDTIDGTGVRDYIHVVDLAIGHVAALENISPGVEVFNLGTGSGTSVLELVVSFEKAVGKKIPYKITQRRPGDIASCYASAQKITSSIGWTAKKDLDSMCRDAYHWQTNNPNGYD